MGENGLDLHSGEWVEVKTKDEILKTLDANGELDQLPFMPEMLHYCGRRFKVWKRAEKACDTIYKTGARRMMNAVHLEDQRCDGAAHGGCQAGCLLFWKEAWLKRASEPGSVAATPAPIGTPEVAPLLWTAARGPREPKQPTEEVYRCQATRMFEATVPMAWWDVRQYWRDKRCGNVKMTDLARAALFSAANVVLNKLKRTPLLTVSGPVRGRTPCGTALGLVEGELVQIKSRQEILATLNEHGRNRGLRFDSEMIRYCGKKYEVQRRVEKIINERTGVMMTMPNDCIILKGVTCVGDVSPKRLFCQRAIYPYWRELWLQRLER